MHATKKKAPNHAEALRCMATRFYPWPGVDFAIGGDGLWHVAVGRNTTDHVAISSGCACSTGYTSGRAGSSIEPSG